MPMLTRKMVIQQQMARNVSRATTPSTPSSHSTSPVSSLSSSPASTSSSRSRSPVQPSQGQMTPNKCWIPTLDEVSRADPDERAQIFARLAREAGHDARQTAPRTPERRVKAIATRYSSVKPSDYSSVEIGAMALEPLRLSEEQPIEHLEFWTPEEGSDLYDPGMMEINDQMLPSEWIVEVPDSPITSSFSMSHGTISEEVIAGWTKEDVEMETIYNPIQDRLRKMGYSI
ncbi:unnamed protein product [Rhizoctonia solani]|uniref:Uncharacterized protein n=1 Tax=Rhizoctonia solani TaxID=456999 RepID=A0A8H2Y1W0_9AGAM|nr:unnamed protein product [Rhizoctonia solani]